MKKLLITLILFVVITAGIPLTILGMMYDGSANDEIPRDLYTESLSGMDRLLMDVEAAFEEARGNPEADLEIALSEDIINSIIYDRIIGDDENEGTNPNYLPTEDCVDDQCYILQETIDLGGRVGTIRLNGLWVTFEEDLIVGNAAIEVQYEDGFTFKSRVKLQVLVEDDLENDEFIIAFDRVSIGRIPLTRGLFTRVISLVNRVTGGNSIGTDALGLGTLDVNNLEYRIEKSEFVDMIAPEDGEENDLTVTLLTTIFENNLITFKLEDTAFMVNVRMSIMRNVDVNDIPSYLYDLHDIDGEFDGTLFNAERHLQSRFEAFVFNMALTGNTALTINQRTFNKILYQSMDGFEELGFVYEYNDSLGNPQAFVVDFRALWFEFDMEDNEIVLSIKGLFDFDGIPSLLEIRAEEISSSSGIYVFEITEVSLGKEPGKDEYLSISNLEPFKNFLKDMDDFPFGEIDSNGNLVINTAALTDLIDDGAVEGSVSVGSVEIVQGGIRINIEASDQNLQAILDDFSDALNTVFTDPNINTTLESSLNTVDDGPEKDTYDTFTNIQNKINANDPITEEDIETLFESYDQMSPESQEAFMNAFKDSIDPSLVDDFESSFQD